MSMEISPQHHPIVLGKGSCNLKAIMQRTHTQIMFPDASDPNIPNIKKSNITITGQINNVYLARQQLMVCKDYSKLLSEVRLGHLSILLNRVMQTLIILI